VTTRRTFLKYTAVGIGLGGAGFISLGSGRTAYAADARPLIDGVSEACKRLASLGWRQLLLDATGGALDITAADLKAELTKPLARIDRSYRSARNTSRGSPRMPSRRRNGRARNTSISAIGCCRMARLRISI